MGRGRRGGEPPAAVALASGLRGQVQGVRGDGGGGGDEEGVRQALKVPSRPPFTRRRLAMAMSVGSVGGGAAAQYAGAVATTSLAQTKLKGEEAVDLVKSAMSASSSGRLLSTYA